MPTPDTFIAEFDGGSRGNPGPAGIGVVVRAADGTPLVTLGRFIGRATNNVAEYRALITALTEAIKLNARHVLIRGDSELIIKQMRGEYRVRHPDLKPLHEEALSLVRHFDEAKFEHNLRHKNELADRLANKAMDQRRDVTDEGEGDPASPGSESHTCPNCGCEIEVIRPSPKEIRPFTCACGHAMRAMK